MSTLIFVPMVVRSQQTVTYSVCAGQVTKALVRYAGPGVTVSYREDVSGHYFCYDDRATMMRMEHRISDNVSVEDFETEGGYVYFCGRETTAQSGMRGVFGVIEVAHMQVPGMVYYTYSGFLSPVGTYVAEYGDISVVTDSMGEVRCALVGTSQGGVSCVAELWGAAVPPAGWSYRIGVSQQTGEVFSLVCHTGSYVVTAGSVPQGQSYEALHIYNKTDMFMAGGPQDSVYAYTASSPNGYARPSGLPRAMTCVGGDWVAIAQDYSGDDVDYMNHGIRLGIYDAAGTLSVPGCSSVDAIYATLTTHPEIKGMRSLAVTPTRFMLLLGGEITQGVYGNAVAELYYPFPTTVGVTLMPGQGLESIDMYETVSNPYCYVAAGPLPGMPTQMMEVVKMWGTTMQQCATTTTYYVTKAGYNCKSEADPLTSRAGVFSCTVQQELQYRRVPIEVECQERNTGDGGTGGER